MNLYVTSDKIGAGGGGLVVLHQSEALKELGLCEYWDAIHFNRGKLDGVWSDDNCAVMDLRGSQNAYKIAHLYSGTFPKTVRRLKEAGCKVIYSLDAHDREVSKREHEALGMPFPYPHLTDPNLWNRYIDGYRHADVITCSGEAPARVVREYGPDFAAKRIEVIPHGCDIPELPITALPGRFTVGYMGAAGPDKGLRYLFAAWKLLNYSDATLVIAGRDSTQPFVRQLWNYFGGGHVHFAGWQYDVSDFYNSVSLYVQPSATEGFGLEVLEAMAHGRMVLCSRAAGAECLLPEELTFPPWNPNTIVERIEWARKQLKDNGNQWGEAGRDMASIYSWANICKRYQNLYKELLT